jgi:hypothetical protein
MTLKLHLPPDLEGRLRREAERQGLPAEQCTLRLLDEHLPPSERGAGLRELVGIWIAEDDAGEQQETGEFLVRSLDQDRLSDRKLFPSELKGVTW